MSRHHTFGNWQLTIGDCGFSYEDSITWLGDPPPALAEVPKDQLLLVILLWQVDKQVVLGAQHVPVNDDEEVMDMVEDSIDVPAWDEAGIRAAAVTLATKHDLGDLDNLVKAVRLAWLIAKNGPKKSTD